MLMRYCARATDSALPVMVMVLSMLEPAGLALLAVGDADHSAAQLSGEEQSQNRCIVKHS